MAPPSNSAASAALPLRFAAEVRRRLVRDRSLPLAAKLGKALDYVTARATAAFRLRDCDALGPGARTIAGPVVENLGRIEAGSGLLLNSRYAPVRLSASPGAEIRLGDRVIMNFGVEIAAAASVRIGDRVSLAPYVSISDHEPSDPDPRPIVIGDDVWLATRVRVRPGAVIGARAVITAGSVVEGEIPPGVVAGGIPARILQRREPAEAVAPAPRAAAVARDPEGRGLVIADFSAQELAALLRKPDELGSSLELRVAPFGQVVQTLHGLDAWTEGHSDFALVWTRPESFAAFEARMRGEETSDDDLLAEVDAFAAMLMRAAGSVKHLFVPTWFLPAYHRGLGLLDSRPGGLAHALARMNLRLAEAVAARANIHVLNAQKWLEAAGPSGVSAKLWYLGKVGFSTALLAEAARDLRAAWRGIRGSARKLIVLDLDDTLWGGIVGDVGWQNLRLGGHDGLGEAFVDFQRHLKALARRGIALAVASKNEESVALTAMREHPEMVLRPSDLAAWRINWDDKARNIVEIVKELNLGVQSVVFLDDNPVERARVREALPEVYVPEWPEDKLLYTTALLQLRCFDAPTLTREDRERTQAYASEREREALRAGVGSLDEWLAGLGLRVRFARLDAASLPRTTQLLNKTNQMNLRTRRLSEPELLAWAEQPEHEVWSVSVSDRFGDAGLTGILSLAFEGEVATLVDYVLSCRVMGRRVEETLVCAAVARARARGARSVAAPFFPTEKNKPCHSFWLRSGFARQDGDVFTWSTEAAYPMPASVTAEGIDLG